jgi:hypothetical protein
MKSFSCLNISVLNLGFLGKKPEKSRKIYVVAGLYKPIVPGLGKGREKDQIRKMQLRKNTGTWVSVGGFWLTQNGNACSL